LNQIFKELLADFDGGLVLDVATAEGGFIQVLCQSSLDYATIIGIDVNIHALRNGRGKVSDEDAVFCVMDASRMSFCDRCFDTVSLGVSLHHLAYIHNVLDEMNRVLKPGGYFILSEMHKDATTEAQKTGVMVHHWAASVDTELGIPHFQTLSRHSILDLLDGLGLHIAAQREFNEDDKDLFNPEVISSVEEYINKYLARLDELSNSEELRSQGEELQQRLYNTGFQREPLLIILSRKP
jgi:ubiquinone/menaquinone biosynthesis C-methylase UbiE